jgi:NAD(P)-dependent dehydrogenase (short-subunit alcohol dehydrogenase family)
MSAKHGSQGSSAGTLLLAGMGAGLGASVAGAFIAAGYRVAGLSRRTASDLSLEGDLDRWGDAYRHYLCDVTRADQVEATVRTIRADLGAPTVMVYNPMRLLIKPFLELTIEEFESVWRVTCLGAVVTARAVLGPMLEAGNGTLIFSGATASTRGSAKFSSLAVGKCGLRGLAQSLAREFGPQGIHVVHTILDGLIWAPQTRSRFDPREDQCMSPRAIAQTYLHVAQQHRSAWTHEIDLRPAHGAF